ncbi:acyl-CoA dehydrogenase FadE [Mycolicibacterium phlei]|uniref:acyl-CoA dehydrogenase IpdE2 n=1 Tax=Mycobacteroides chelonae TaxID=1774 RepID=UPI000618BD12|nr:acyl-CoA dehydrogenase family protein [Mycobacteroides chelonae]AKC37713.1 acyl-CoA dehydrogenase [Mycobacteroides chelonae]ANA96796.1 acyl-CoA dehydrogenase [Mycobacteroides chelonae CCUG 47445]ORV17130.1 acyl-CoA dehydrogenase [Mycobacteroides chelonae]VEG14705.1 acyl-CoA dehydrogenase FadE [Mycolicibacterium phlei]
MSTSSNDERQMLRDTVRSLVTKRADSAAVRKAMESERGFDENLWTVLCEQVGAAALLVPEELGGAGGELADAAVVVEELGRGLVPSPLMGTLWAELALLDAGYQGELLESLAAGESIGAVAFDPGYVLNGAIADVVLTLDGDEVHRAENLTATALSTMDPTRRLAAVVVSGNEPIGTAPGLIDKAGLLLAAEQVGAAARALELTVEYTKTRVQFGRTIGSFQALKHRMADLYVLVESARAIVYQSIQDLTAEAATVARIKASEALSAVAADSIQLHGGIAITWEHDAHLYFKRAHGSALLLGTPRQLLPSLQSAAGL